MIDKEILMTDII